MNVRAAVVAALNTQPVGADPYTLTLRATPTPPKVVRAGACWPLVESWEPITPGLFAATWRVVLALPPAGDEAAHTADAVATDVAQLLQAAGWVERIEPLELQAGGGTIPALVFTLTPDA